MGARAHVHVLSCPLGLGGNTRGVAHGPGALLGRGLVDALHALGAERVTTETIGVDEDAGAEIAPEKNAHHLPAIAAFLRSQADAVAKASAAGALPLVLGGDHSIAMGTAAGLARALRRDDDEGAALGLAWIDAHADMNTPATSPSGNVHGMPLAVALGHGPAVLCALSGARPALRAEHVTLLAVRDIDDTERALVESSGVRVIGMAELRARGMTACAAEAVARATTGTRGFWCSFDLDALDPRAMPAAALPVDDGLTLAEGQALLDEVSRAERLLAFELVELEPAKDDHGVHAQSAIALVRAALHGQLSRHRGPVG